MRRVVVTGWAWCATRLRRATTWTRILNGQAAPRKIDTLRSPISPARLRAWSRAATAATALQSDQWMEPKDQRKVDDFIIFAMAPRGRRSDDALAPRRPNPTNARPAP